MAKRYGYRHVWMIRLSDWLYNRYMENNREYIEKHKVKRYEKGE